MDVANGLGFRVYRDLVRDDAGPNRQDSLAFSPLALSTALAMVFLGARGATSWQMNELLRLDEMITFNPHLMFKDVQDELLEASNDGEEDGGGGVAACVKLLLVDEVRKKRSRG